MMRCIGLDDKHSGHERMQIAAGFGAAEDKFAGSVGCKFYR